MSMYRASRVLSSASARAVASSAGRDGAVSAALSWPNAAHEGCKQSVDATFASRTTEGQPIGPSSFTSSWSHVHSVLTLAQRSQQDDLRLVCSLWAGNQGNNYQGNKPAENPRNDVPPVDPEGRPGDVPPSPDKTNAKVNDTDYSSPGTGTDASKSRNPVGGTSDGNKPGSGGQKLAPRDGSVVDPAAAPWSAMTQALFDGDRVEGRTVVGDAGRAWVNLAPVEAMLEGNSGVTDTIMAEKQGPTNPADDPPGHDRPDPQVVPAEETPEDTEAIEEEKKKIKQRKAETGAPNQGIQSGDSERKKSPATQI